MMTQVTGSEVQQAERHSGSPPATDNLLMAAHYDEDDDDNDGDNYEEQENMCYKDAEANIHTGPPPIYLWLHDGDVDGDGDHVNVKR